MQVLRVFAHVENLKNVKFAKLILQNILGISS